MHLRRRRQVTTAGLAVCAVALAACSSSSSSSSSSASTGTSSATASASSNASLSGTLNGSGSTFQTVFQQSAIAAFRSVDAGITVNYGSGGSGKGRTDLASGVVNYAGSDSPIPAADVPLFKGKTVLYFPVIIGPITMAYNLSGVSNLKLDPDGHREHLRRQDHHVERPGHRVDQLRGQPAQHADHDRGPLGLLGHHAELHPVPQGRRASVWTLGSSSTIKWPTTARAGAGNPGVAQIVKSTPGAIGYVDYADAKASGLSFASVKNSTGAYIAPSPSSASAAADSATIATNLTFAAVWAPGATAYPITYQSWDLVYAMQPNANDAAMLKAWIGYLISPTGGQSLLGGLGYAPLPSNLDQMAVSQLSQITS